MSEDEKQDNARNYLRASEKLWKENNTKKAIKFLEKAQNCWPLPEIPSYFEKYKTPFDPSSPSSVPAFSSSLPSYTPTNSSSSSSARNTSTESPSCSTSSPSSFSSPSPSHEEPKFTTEQQEEAVRVSKLKNYYDILGIKKEATEDDIKRAYRKLAIKLHPDKNHAPAAEDAFKKVTQAYSCLSDGQKKSFYDIFGEEQGANGEEPIKPDLTPEQIDEMFFTPEGAPLPIPEKKAPTGVWKYFQLLPLALLITLAFLFGNQTPSYSLLATSECALPRVTTSQTPFFTSASFESYDPRARKAAESEMDMQYVRTLNDACGLEKLERQTLVNSAKNLKGQELKDKLREVAAFSMDSCELHKAMTAG